jgi:hypothetical protein
MRSGAFSFRMDILVTIEKNQHLNLFEVDIQPIRREPNVGGSRRFRVSFFNLRGSRVEPSFRCLGQNTHGQHTHGQ